MPPHRAACFKRALTWFKDAVVLEPFVSEPGSLHTTEPVQAVGSSPQETGVLKAFPQTPETQHWAATQTAWGRGSKCLRVFLAGPWGSSVVPRDPDIWTSNWRLSLPSSRPSSFPTSNCPPCLKLILAMPRSCAYPGGR